MISTSRIRIKDIIRTELSKNYRHENDVNYGAQLLRDTDGACVYPLIVRRNPQGGYNVVIFGKSVFVARCAVRAAELYGLTDVTAYILDDAGDPLNPLTPTQRAALEQQICFLGA